jgi:hypothetical protein
MDGNGWTGVTQVWLDGNTKEGVEHIIHLRQDMPLGSIHVDVEGVGLTERDLQWAALYASEVLKRKNDLLKKM